MEKQVSSAGGVQQFASSRPTASADRATSAAKRLTIIVLAAILLPLGYLFRHPLANTLPSASCHGRLAHISIEQRAHKILKENPLIGQTENMHIATTADAQQMVTTTS